MIEERILAAVCEVSGVPEEHIVSTSKTPHVVEARYLVCHLLNLRGWSQVAIGKLLNRDSSSIHSALKVLPDNTRWYEHVSRCLERLKPEVTHLVSVTDFIVIRRADGSLWRGLPDPKDPKWEQIPTP